MTIDLEDTLSLIRDQAARLLSNVATPERLKMLLDQATGFDTELWRAASEQGWPASALPESAEGIGLGWHGLCVLMEEIGRTTASLPLIGNTVTASAVLTSDNTELIENHLAPLANGKQVACLAFAEPNQTGLSIQPAVKWSHNKLTGSKAVTPFAAIADLAVVPAVNDAGNIVLVLVSLHQETVTRQVKPTLDNARAAAALTFSGATGTALTFTDSALEFQRLASLAALATAFEQIGGAAASLDMAISYALERKAFGQPIGRFQAIKHKLANIYWRLEIARGCALDALEALEENNPLWLGLVAAARLSATEAYDFAAQENIQTHGALGVTWEAMPHHYYRRARCLAIELGSALYWREQLLAEHGFGNNSKVETRDE